MQLHGTCGQRLLEERKRTGWTSEQAAVLSGVSHDRYLKFESGEASMTLDYVMALEHLGMRPKFIGLGEASDEQIVGVGAQQWKDEFVSNVIYRSSFKQAVQLMMRSAAAVEAFVGKGKSESCPELVAALMNATMKLDLEYGEEVRLEAMNEKLDGIAGAIEGLRDE